MKRINDVLNETGYIIDQHILEDFIARGWVCPVRDEEDYIFEDIDITRIHLAYELCVKMEFEVDAVDIILSLMDQLYESRMQVCQLTKALKERGI